jgi:hypothetical protein
MIVRFELGTSMARTRAQKKKRAVGLAKNKIIRGGEAMSSNRAACRIMIPHAEKN